MQEVLTALSSPELHRWQGGFLKSNVTSITRRVSASGKMCEALTTLSFFWQKRKEPTAIPPLVAYRLRIQGGDLAAMGGKVAYRLQRVFKGHWLWTEKRVVTDSPPPDEALKPVIADLWKEQPDIFQGLLAIQPDASWRPTAQVQADFVARALFRNLQPEVNQVLAPLSQDLGRVRIHRTCDVRGWVVRGQPAISISVVSRLLAKQDLRAYARQATPLEQLVGLAVTDKLSGSKGEIAGITGTVREHRERLLALTQREESRVIIQRAADNEPVVHVRMGRNAYDFVASALGIVVSTATYARFGVDAKQATSALRLAPQERLKILVNLGRVFTDKKGVTTFFRTIFPAKPSPSEKEREFSPLNTEVRRIFVKDHSPYAFWRSCSTRVASCSMVGWL